MIKGSIFEYNCLGAICMRNISQVQWDRIQMAETQPDDVPAWDTDWDRD